MGRLDNLYFGGGNLARKLAVQRRSAAQLFLCFALIWSCISAGNRKLIPFQPQRGIPRYNFFSPLSRAFGAAPLATLLHAHQRCGVFAIPEVGGANLLGHSMSLSCNHPSLFCRITLSCIRTTMGRRACSAIEIIRLALRRSDRPQPFQIGIAPAAVSPIPLAARQKFTRTFRICLPLIR